MRFIPVTLNVFCSFQVAFSNRVSIKEHPKINEWLTLVEKEMRMTLATLLASAVSNIGPFKAGQIDQKEYMKWVDSYQVIIIL